MGFLKHLIAYSLRLCIAFSAIAGGSFSASAQFKTIECARMPFTSSISFGECTVENAGYDVFRGTFRDQTSAASVVMYKTPRYFALTTAEQSILGVETQQRPWAFKNFLAQVPSRSSIRPGKYLSFPAVLVQQLQGQPTTCAHYFKWGATNRHYFSGLFCMVGTEVPEALIDVLVENIKEK